MESKLISIIIPCYNDVKYIEQSVNSALNQTYAYKEVIVIDDGSNLKTKEVLKKLEPQLTKLITQENQGQSTARNVGIRAAKGVYILVLDSDDFFEETFCEKAITLIENSTDEKLVSCYTNLLFDDGTSTCYKPIGGALKDFLFSNSAMGSVLFKKQDWEKVGGYDEDMREGFEDWEFYIRLLATGGKAAIVDEYLFNYRKRTNSTSSRANASKLELLEYIYLKHSNLYKNNFELFVKHVFWKVQKEEKEALKHLERIEYKIGFNLLKPYRFVMKLLSSVNQKRN